MEFVGKEEVADLLGGQGVVLAPSDDGERMYLRMEDDGAGGVVRLHLASAESETEPDEGARLIPMALDQLPGVVDKLVNRLHLKELILLPVGKWRKVFDAVAFSLADNEDWHEIDTTATVELNTRDPLLCELGDFQTVTALVRALLSDAESPDQGLMMTTTAAPLLLEIIPDGAIRMSFGSQVLADEITEALVV